MSLKVTLQKMRLRLGKFFLDKKTPENSTALLPKKVLFLRQDGKIGDYIVSSFVFREIKRQDPSIEIGVVCTKKDAYLFQQNPHIDHLYYVKKRSIVDYIRQGMILSKLQYDVVIDPTIALKNRDLLLLRLINAKNYIGYKKSTYQLFNFNIEGEYHFSELYRLALAKVGILCKDISYDIPFNQQSAVEIQQFLANNQLKDYITVNFFGAYRAKKVNDENIVRYLDYLTDIKKEKQFVLLSYPEVTEKLKNLAEKYENIFVHDTKTIFHTIELIRHCSYLISTDTATVHIAAGLHKKMVAIYKEDNIAFTHWQPNSKEETHILFYQENINELSPEKIKPEWLDVA